MEDIYPEGLYMVQGDTIAGDIMGVEFPALFQRFLRDHASDGPVQSLEDVVAWYEENPAESQWAWDSDAMSTALWSPPEWGEQHIAWIEELHYGARERGIDLAIEDYGVEAFVAPTSSLPARWDNTSYFWASSQLAASAGYPSVTVPIGYTENLPAGLHFFGPAFSERKLIRFAAELERILQVRQAPQFLEYTDYDDIYAPPPW